MANVATDGEREIATDGAYFNPQRINIAVSTR
jgi:hypothetical protein